jgi:transcriptional regulator with XRE-family HTH domain
MGKYIDPEIGIRLAEIRRRRGLTQRQLATAIGVTLTSLQNYERGRNAVTDRRLDALACALRCKPIDLLTRPGEEPT